MKASRSFTQAISAIALTTCFVSDLPAQEIRTTASGPAIAVPAPRAAPIDVDFSQGVYVASIDADNYGLRRYAGQKLYNLEGAELGSVRDFIVHPLSSRVRYLVVSTGGVLGGIGNSLRLVPFEVVRRGGPYLFQVDILQANWLQIPPVNDRDYVVDRFLFSPELHQQMLRPFGPANGTVIAGASGPNDWTGLMRASVLRGKNIIASDRKVGTIDNIIIDLERGLAAALLDSSADFTGTAGKYLIPLGRLVFTDPRQNPIGTTLTRTDFELARQSTFGAPATVASVPPPPAAEPALPPTGRPSAATTPAVSESLIASARAVRQAIDRDPSLVAENVQVSPENGRIVLRGSVRSDSVRTALENTAHRAVTGVTIESQITILRP